MDVFDALLRQAVSGLLAANLTLSEEAAGRACADASVQLLRKICALALDPSVEDAQALELAKCGAYIKVLNKADLKGDETETDADVTVSAATGEGFAELKRLLVSRGVGERTEESAFLVEERHYQALSRAKEALKSALADIDSAPLDLLSVTVQEAWETLGEITGETASEEIISEIFSKFCVGK